MLGNKRKQEIQSGVAAKRFKLLEPEQSDPIIDEMSDGTEPLDPITEETSRKDSIVDSEILYIKNKLKSFPPIDALYPFDGLRQMEMDAHWQIALLERLMKLTAYHSVYVEKIEKLKCISRFAIEIEDDRAFYEALLCDQTFSTPPRDKDLKGIKTLIYLLTSMLDAGLGDDCDCHTRGLIDRLENKWRDGVNQSHSERELLEKLEAKHDELHDFIQNTMDDLNEAEEPADVVDARFNKIIYKLERYVKNLDKFIDHYYTAASYFEMSDALSAKKQWAESEINRFVKFDVDIFLQERQLAHETRRMQQFEAQFDAQSCCIESMGDTDSQMLADAYAAREQMLQDEIDTINALHAQMEEDAQLELMSYLHTLLDDSLMKHVQENKENKSPTKPIKPCSNAPTGKLLIHGTHLGVACARSPAKNRGLPPAMHDPMRSPCKKAIMA